jgi:hypothetical protein
MLDRPTENDHATTRVCNGIPQCRAQRRGERSADRI